MHRLSLLLLPALVAACTPMPDPPATIPASADRVMAMPAGFPYATYTTTIAAGEAPPEMAAQLVGPWVLAFGDNGHALVTFNGRQVVDAPFSVNGNELVLTTDTGDYACNSTARYTWHAMGNELHLTKVEDACEGRALVLTKHALVRR